MSQKKSNVVALSPGPQQRDFIKLELERSVVSAFRKAAIARQTNAERIARDLLGTIAGEPDLIDSILDDRVAGD